MNIIIKCKHCHWIMIALWFYATYIFQLMTEDLIYLELVCTGCKSQFVLNVKENPWGSQSQLNIDGHMPSQL